MAAVALSVAACSASSPAHAPAGGGSWSAPLSGSIRVFAAASLTEAFGTLGKRFQASHPATTVTLSFGASSTLATQITQGAPADVFASAAPKNMDTVVRAGDASAPVVFAKNSMEIAVPPANPARITAVADLARSGVKVALCQPQVPCGAAAAALFGRAKITVKPVTLEADVKSTLAKVRLGEVDAGVVYVTDVKAAGSDVLGVPITAAVNASTAYPIAALTTAKNPLLAQAFLAYVRSTKGQAVLTQAGFSAP
jgi:molybdate transport system substrate-binding protein